MIRRCTRGTQSPVGTLVPILVVVGLALGACGASDGDKSSDTLSSEVPSVSTRLFTDPDGTYTITIPDEWVAFTETGPGIEAWVVSSGAEPAGVDISTLRTTKESVDDFMQDEGNRQNPALEDLTYLNTEVVTTAQGEVGIIEYTGIGRGTPLHLLGFVVIKGTTAIVATFTAPTAIFEEVRLAVEPFLMTLTPS